MDQRQRDGLHKIAPEDVRFDCAMDQYTTFRVGGNAEAVCFPRELDHLQQMVSYLGAEDIPYMISGKGSNLLVRDGGLKGAVIILRGKLAVVEKDTGDDKTVIAGGGLTISDLLSYCSHNGLAGLEFLAGIPGTVGGAVAMNAGAYGKEIGSVIQKIDVLTDQGVLAAIDRSDLEFSYRDLSLEKGVVILSATFELNKEKPEIISGRIADYLKSRKETQPIEHPSGGSVFKNPPGDYAGRLIEQAGLKGKQIGGALISPKHANFIVNTGGAKAQDILALIVLAREKVREETGIELDPEIRVVGV